MGHVTTDQNTFTANDQLVTKAFVDTSIANLVDSAPSTLDTLNELAAALGNDPNFATTVTNNIATKLPIANVQTSTSTTSGHVYDVTYLNTQLAGKANTSHTHAISEITNLQTSLDSKLNLTGGSLSGHVTTNQASFTSSNQLVSKNYVDTRLPTDVETPVSYTIQNAETDQNYLFGVNGAANEMALVEIPKVYTGVSASSRSARVGFNGGDYGTGMVSLGYEALADGSGSAGQTNAVRSVAVGYQAGYQSQAANHGIYIGPYQGYQLSTSNQLRIGNSGVAPTTTGYDKAIIEGTMGTTDAGQTLRLNADTIYLGSSLPTSQPADNRLWLSNGNLSIGAVSGGGGGGGGGSSSAVQVDPLTFGQSGGSNTTINGVTQSPDLHRTGITIGDRRFKWFVEDSFFAKSSLSKEFANGVINGYLRVYGLSSSPVGPGNYSYTGTADNETVFEENVLEGGHITFTPNNGVHYKFRGIRLNADSYATDFTQLSPAGTGLYNSCVANGADCRLAAFGLKDGVWKWLGTVSLNNNGAPNSGTIANPKDDTTMAENPLTPSTTLRSEQMDFGSVLAPAIGITGSGSSQEVNGSIGAIGMLNWGTSNVKWPGFQPTPLLNVRRGQGTVYSGTYLWKFTHNIDFYQSYRIQHVKTGLTTTVNSVQYQRFNDNRSGQNGMTEVEFWAGVGT
jgi:hypothetical protein